MVQNRSPKKRDRERKEDKDSHKSKKVEEKMERSRKG